MASATSGILPWIPSCRDTTPDSVAAVFSPFAGQVTGALDEFVNCRSNPRQHFRCFPKGLFQR